MKLFHSLLYPLLGGLFFASLVRMMSKIQVQNNLLLRERLPSV